MQDIIRNLLQKRGPHCLTLLVPTAYHSFAELGESKLLLKQAVHEAEKLLKKNADLDTREALLANLNRLIEAVDLNHPPQSIGCFVTETFAEMIGLPFPVEKKVIFSDTFELQDLLHNLDQMVPYYALHISKGQTRLFQGTGPDLQEIKNDDFPRVFHDDHQVSRTSPHSLYTVDPSTVDQRRLENFLREVHKTAERYVSDKPLLLIGVDKDIALYKKLCPSPHFLPTHLHGNYDKAALHTIRQVVWPLVAEQQAAKERTLLDRVAQSVKSKDAVYGIGAILPIINHRPNVHLIIEKDYEHSGFFDPKTKSLNLEISPVVKGAVEVPNLVEHMIENVLQSEKGHISIVAPQALQPYNHIVAIPLS